MAINYRNCLHAFLIFLKPENTELFCPFSKPPVAPAHFNPQKGGGEHYVLCFRFNFWVGDSSTLVETYIFCRRFGDWLAVVCEHVYVCVCRRKANFFFRVMKYQLLHDLGYIWNVWCFYKNAFIASRWQGPEKKGGSKWVLFQSKITEIYTWKISQKSFSSSSLTIQELSHNPWPGCSIFI